MIDKILKKNNFFVSFIKFEVIVMTYEFHIHYIIILLYNSIKKMKATSPPSNPQL